MFESYIGQLLTSLLGAYFKEECFAPNKVKASVAYGHVVLEDLELKQSALDFLDLPITVVKGFVGQAEFKIGGGNWTKLGSKPVEVWLDRVFLVVRPDFTLDPERIEKRNQKSKLDAV